MIDGFDDRFMFPTIHNLSNSRTPNPTKSDGDLSFSFRSSLPKMFSRKSPYLSLPIAVASRAPSSSRPPSPGILGTGLFYFILFYLFSLSPASKYWYFNGQTEPSLPRFVSFCFLLSVQEIVFFFGPGWNCKYLWIFSSFTDLWV